MGIHNREYMRDGGRGAVWGGGASGEWPSVCKWLIIANIVVFVLQMFTAGKSFDVQTWLELDTSAVLHGQIWRIFTCAFCHSVGSFMHILFNMLFLWCFGKTLERMYGSREFLMFYIAATFWAGAAYIGLDLFTGSRVPAIGASGAVMAVTMLYAMHYPRHKIYIWMVLPVEIRWVVLAYVVFDLYPVLVTLSSGRVLDNVAHIAHLGGLAFGFLYFKRKWRMEALWSRLTGGLPRIVIGKKQPTKGKSKSKIIAMPGAKASPAVRSSNSPDFEAEVDRILQKIADSGTSSLTPAERSTLESASEQIRAREK